MHHVAVQRWPRAILGKQRDLSAMSTALVERFDRLAPCRSLVVVDLSQMKHMSLHRAPAGNTAVFNDAPIAVLLAVLAALWRRNMQPRFRMRRTFRKALGRHRRPFAQIPRTDPALF